MKEGEEEEEEEEEYGAHLYCEVLRALAAIWLVRLGCLPRGVDTCWGTNGTFAEYHDHHDHHDHHHHHHHHQQQPDEDGYHGGRLRRSKRVSWMRGSGWMTAPRHRNLVAKSF